MIFRWIIISVRKEILKIWDENKLGLDLSDYDEDKYFKIVSEKIDDGLDLSWKKDSRVKYLDVQDLAVILFAIEKTNQANVKNKSLCSNSFSYNQAKMVLQKYGRGSNRNKIAAMFRVLKEINLIEKEKSYIPGERGTCYLSVRFASGGETVSFGGKTDDWEDLISA